MNFYPSGMRQNVNVNLFRKPFHSYSVNNEGKIELMVPKIKIKKCMFQLMDNIYGFFATENIEFPITYLQGLSYDLDKVKNMMNNAFHDIEIDNKYKMTYHVSNVPVLFIWRNKIQAKDMSKVAGTAFAKI